MFVAVDCLRMCRLIHENAVVPVGTALHEGVGIVCGNLCSVFDRPLL